MNLVPYPKYKNSGVEWLGQVPEEWAIIKLRSVLLPIVERNKPDWPLLSVVREKGVIVRNIKDDSDNHNVIPEDLTNYKVVHSGQLAMNKMKAWQGSYGVSKFDGIVSPAYYVFNIHNADLSFFHIAIRSKLYVAFFAAASDGIRIGQWDLSTTRMKEIPFFIPPLSEQTQIARFLDWKTREIAKFIKAKKRMIELLKEQKQVIINDAVTGKIDVTTGKPYPKYKDSGVEWLKTIPKHWEEIKMRFIGYLYGGLSGKTAKDFNIKKNVEYKKYIPFSNIANNQTINPENLQKVRINQDERQNKVKKNDIFFLMSSETYDDVGKASLLIRNLENTYLNSFCKGFRITKKGYNSKFINYQLMGKSLRYNLKIKANGFTRINLRINIIKDLYISTPPYLEQIAIANYLDKKMVQINDLIAKNTSLIELLQNFRSTLTSDVVTGKIDVRNIKIPKGTEQENADNDININKKVD